MSHNSNELKIVQNVLVYPQWQKQTRPILWHAEQKKFQRYMRHMNLIL